MGLISDTGKRKIADAIADAERKTSGEIVAVISAESSSYLYAPFMWAAVIALLVPWLLIHFTAWPSTWVYFAQLVVFLVLLILLFPRPVRYWLVPRQVKQARAQRRAFEQFLVQNLHTTKGRTGVLIFVSLAEHHAEILADEGINAHVPKETWQAIVDAMSKEIGSGRLVEGMVSAVESVGALLATHFPPGSADANELPDHVIVIEREVWP